MAKPVRPFPSAGYWLRFAVLVALYAALGSCAAGFGRLTHFESPIWPVAGLSLAAVYLWGYSMLPAIFAGALLYAGAFAGRGVAAAVGIGCGSCLSAALGAYGFRLCGFRPHLGRVRDVVIFVLIGVIVSQIPSAVVGTAALAAFSTLPRPTFARQVSEWWGANMLGVVWITPLLLVWHGRLGTLKDRSRRLEVGALAGLLAVLLICFFLNEFATIRARSYLVRPHMLFPFFVWASIRFRQRGAATIGFATIGTLIVATLAGAAPYKSLSVSQSFLYLQSFIIILAVTSLFLGAACEQSADALRALHRSEAAARRQEAEFRGLFDCSGAGNAQVDRSGRFLRVNSKLCEILGFSATELVGRRFEDFTHPGDIELSLARLEELHRAPGSQVAFEKRYIRGDGAVIWVAVIATFLEDAEGRATTSLAVVNDITGRKLAEEELKRAMASADAANLAKSQFLANISHEIRTPLGAILGFNEFTFDPDQTPEDRLLGAHKIKQNGDLLLRIINDVLDLSKVEAGRLETEHCRVALGELLDDVSSLLDFKAREDGTTLSFRVDGGVPAAIESDPTRLRQILINIVGNALKFSGGGTVDVRVRHIVQDGAKPILEFIVRDSGVGMTEEHTAHLFEPFHQADLSTTRKFGGTGLGLVLARNFARALGGDLRLVETAPGKGSTFMLTIMAPPARDAAPDRRGAARRTTITAPTPAGRLRDVKVLVVDDAVDNRLLFSRFLQREGAVVIQAESGEEAIERAMASDCDVVLIDIQMPGLDGFQATGILRSRGYRKPILAVTAHAMEDDRKRSLDAGCDDHLAKPVSPAQLIETVRHFALRV